MADSPVCLVPMKIDALALSRDRSLIQPAVDFAGLPYFDGKNFINPKDKSYAPGDAVSPPFQDANLWMRRGLHLHWALPDAFIVGKTLRKISASDLVGAVSDPVAAFANLVTAGVLDPSGVVQDGFDPTRIGAVERGVLTALLLNAPRVLDFVRVPNRWLVVRSTGGAADRRWIVESDYLHPDDQEEAGFKSGSIGYPVEGDRRIRAPYRRLGRVLPAEGWSESAAANEKNHLEKLTAVGYGEPNFHAFYPNCPNVFGMRDPEFVASVQESVYEVYGWFSDPSWDPLQASAGAAANLESLQWAVPAPNQGSLPDKMRTLCYARISVAKTATTTNAVVAGTDTANPKVAIGQSGTEALSAFIAESLTTTESARLVFEDQLEALHLSRELEHRKIDVGFKFEEARHSRGFSARSSGLRWSVKPQGGDDPDSGMTLGADLAASLDNLNKAQSAYDAEQREIDSAREALFADWCRYMEAAYPPEDGGDSDLVDPDRIKFFVRGLDIPDLQRRLNRSGTWKLYPGPDGAVYYSAGGGPNSLAIALKAALDSVLAAVQAYNAGKGKVSADALDDEVVGLGNSAAVIQALVAAGFLDSNGNIVMTEAQLAPLLNGSKALPIAGTYSALQKQKIVRLFGRVLSRPSYGLHAAPGPRYWRAKEPVVLIEGAVAKPTERHGGDGLLACASSEADLGSISSPAAGQALSKSLDGLASVGAKGFSEATQQPWNPLYMEWEVEFFPALLRGNQEPGRDGYAADFIRTNYQLAETDTDLTGKPDAPTVRGSGVLTGRSLLSAHARKKLGFEMQTYLARAYCAGNALAPTAKPLEFFRENRSVILGYFESANLKPADPAYAPYRAFKQFFSDGSGPDCQTQALGGFNDALVQLRTGYQLPVADPLAFPEYGEFTDDVASYVEGFNRAMPNSLSDFNPIRAGGLNLVRLRVIDSFGQFVDLVKSAGEVDVIASEPLLPRRNHQISLPPRLSQPARLNFRWISAELDDVESNDHPATTPICGWVLANNLDRSVMIYDRLGDALGAVQADGSWEPVPGSGIPIGPDMIQNRYLRGHVRFLMNKTRSAPDGFMDEYLGALDSAVSHIHPETSPQQQGLSLLIGRPLALVRASVGFELGAGRSVDQAWNAFRQDLERGRRKDATYTAVRWPIRLGECRQFNDGLVGYFIDGPGGYAGFVRPADLDGAVPGFDGAELHRELVECGYLNEDGEIQPAFLRASSAGELKLPDWIVAQQRDDVFTVLSRFRDGVFFAPGSSAVVEPGILTSVTAGGEVRPINLWMSFEDAPRTMTLLLDPRGSVHATTGLLPTKELSVPREHYVRALKEIRVTFLTAPVLGPVSHVELSLPEEPGYAWSWIERRGEQWAELSRRPMVSRTKFSAAFPDAASLWSLLLAAGWLSLGPNDENHAELVPANSRAIPDLNSNRDFAAYAAANKVRSQDVERFLETTALRFSEPKIEAGFGKPLSLREGWLRLKKTT